MARDDLASFLPGFVFPSGLSENEYEIELIESPSFDENAGLSLDISADIEYINTVDGSVVHETINRRLYPRVVRKFPYFIGNGLNRQTRKNEKILEKIMHYFSTAGENYNIDRMMSKVSNGSPNMLSLYYAGKSYARENNIELTESVLLELAGRYGDREARGASALLRIDEVDSGELSVFDLFSIFVQRWSYGGGYIGWSNINFLLALFIFSVGIAKGMPGMSLSGKFYVPLFKHFMTIYGSDIPSFPPPYLMYEHTNKSIWENKYLNYAAESDLMNGDCSMSSNDSLSKYEIKRRMYDAIKEDDNSITWEYFSVAFDRIYISSCNRFESYIRIALSEIEYMRGL